MFRNGKWIIEVGEIQWGNTGRYVPMSAVSNDGEYETANLYKGHTIDMDTHIELMGDHPTKIVEVDWQIEIVDISDEHICIIARHVWDKNNDTVLKIPQNSILILDPSFIAVPKVSYENAENAKYLEE